MKIKQDRKCQYVEAGSKQCASLVRASRDPWLRIEWQAEQARLRAAWSEAQHIKSMKKLEREAEIRHRARERAFFWFRIKAKNWGEEKGQGYKASTSSRAIRIGNTRGWMPRYTTPIRTSQGLLFPFQRTVYRNAKSSKQGAAKDLVLYGADGAHEFDDGGLAFFSSVGLSVEETAEAFDELERVNRSAAANAKVVHHMIIQSMHELPPEEQWAMLLRYCDQTFGSQDLPYSVCLHAPSEQGDQRNWHAHVVFSYRPMVRTDEAEWQIGRAIRTDLDCPEQWTRMRFLLSEELNRTAEMHGVDKRYTHLSYAAAGIDYIPQEHLGAGLTEKVRRGERVELNEQNLAVVARNSALQAVREMRSVLRAGVAAVADFVRTERNALLAAMAIQPATPARGTRAFDIRGVRIPVMPPTLEDGNHRDGVDPANDDIAAPDRGETPSQVAFGTIVPDPRAPLDGVRPGTSRFAHTSPPTLPEALVEPKFRPATIIAGAPALPDSLTEVVPPDTMWKAPWIAPALPMPLVEDEEETPSVWWLATSALATPITPEPIEDAKTEADNECRVAETAPRQPAPLAKSAESSPAWAFNTSSSAECAPQLPAQLGPDGQVSLNSSATWSFHRRAPLYPEALVTNSDANSLSLHEPAVSRPSQPEGTSPDQDFESHFSRLKPDRPAYPIDLTDDPKADESGRSTPTVRSASGATGLEGSGMSERRRKRKSETKSSKTSQRSKGSPSWPWENGGNDLQ
ncbi:MobA/MobL family protein [Qipengyuania sp. 902]|uniref:MobA/MobL family protein n=1 Tax=Qipengyuania sp. 902 TaxID=3417565 RepID=UPI003EBD79B8